MDLDFSPEQELLRETVRGLVQKHLGLDVVRRIVHERCGGEVTVESRPGDTRFRVRLPLAGALA